MSDSATQTPPAKKGRSKLLTIGGPLIVLLLGGAGAGFWYVQNVRAAGTAEKKPVQQESEATGLLQFGAFTVNLADPGGRRYLRVVVHLVLPDAEEAKKIEEEDIVMSKVRAAMLDTLSGRLATELSQPAGRTALKHAIVEAAAHAGHMEVRDVLFQEFIVQ